MYYFSTTLQYDRNIMKKKVRYEFCKLNSIDLEVAAWLYQKCPRGLYAYLEFISKNDYRRKGIRINELKVYQELIKVHRAIH